MDEERICRQCGEPIDGDDEDAVQLEDDSWVCSNCYDEAYFTCDICGEITPIEAGAYWGDAQICADCLEERCPSFDEQENLQETTAAYEALRARCLGRTVAEEHRGRQVTVSWTYGNETDIDYEMTVTVDEACRITDVSRLHAEMLLSEGMTSSDRRPYAVDDSDYDAAGDEIEEQLQLDP